MKAFYLALLFTVSVFGETYQPHDKTKSLFFDEMSIDSMFFEPVYGIELGKTYNFSFEILKEPGAKHSNCMIYTNLKSKKKNDQGKYENKLLKFNEKLGADIPDDGKWHTVSGSFTYEILDSENFDLKTTYFGAHSVRFIVYAKSQNSAKVKIRNLKGLPKFENYLHLGAKKQNLPQVLLIGDSTMYHTYRSKVAAFKDLAAVYYIPVNGGNTKGSVRKYRRWVGDKKWDLIYFNSGIHDLTRSEKGKKGNDFPNAVSVAEYKENLQIIVDYLKTTDAQLVWRTITPIAEGAAGRMQSDGKAYNDAAKEIMIKNNVMVHDVTNAKRQELLSLLSDHVHFGKEGNELLARELMKFIKQNKIIEL